MNTNLSVPHDAVAAAGRAIHYTIAELSRQLKIIPEDDRGHAIVAEEMYVMQNASKSLYSALPVPADLSDRVKALEDTLRLIDDTTIELVVANICREALEGSKP
jgi:hypothetical protein